MSEPLTRDRIEAMCKNLSDCQYHTTATFFLDHDAALRQQRLELEQAVSLLGQQVDMLKQERTRLNAELTECYARMRRER